MLDYLSGEGHNKKLLLLHGFSVGGYMYADTMYTILQNPEKYGKNITSFTHVMIWDAGIGIFDQIE